MKRFPSRSRWAQKHAMDTYGTYGRRYLREQRADRDAAAFEAARTGDQVRNPVVVFGIADNGARLVRTVSQ